MHIGHVTFLLTFCGEEVTESEFELKIDNSYLIFMRYFLKGDRTN